MSHDDDMDPEKLKEILSVVSVEIPKLVEAITRTMYNTENAANMAKAVSEFYKQMKAAGMNEKQAFELTQEFMSSFSLGGIISKAVSGGQHGDISGEIEEKIRTEIRKKLNQDD